MNKKYLAPPVDSGAISPLYAVAEIKTLYKLRDETQVIIFINQHPDLAQILIEAYQPVKESFPDATLFLEFFPTYEGEIAEHLVVNILSALSVKEAVDKLSHFENTWWLNNMERADGNLSFDLEFR